MAPSSYNPNQMGTYRTLCEADVRSILGGFGITGYLSHQPIAVGTINTNTVVETGSGRLFLRINEGKALADVVRETAIVAHVAPRGVPTPVPCVTPAGQPYLQWSNVYASVFPWVQGRTLPRREVGPAHAASVGRGLARLHAAGKDFPDHGAGRYEPDEIQRRLGQVSASAAGDPALMDAVRILGAELATLATERGDVDMGLIHGDLFIDNVLFEESGQVAALLDFEQASWGRLVYDLAVSTLAFGFGSDDFRPDVTRVFIESYIRERPPTIREAAAFGADLRFACCRFAITRITDVYLRRQAGAPTGKDFRRYLARLTCVKEHLARRDGLFALG